MITRESKMSDYYFEIEHLEQENSKLSATISENSGKITALRDKIKGIKNDLMQSWYAKNTLVNFYKRIYVNNFYKTIVYINIIDGRPDLYKRNIREIIEATPCLCIDKLELAYNLDINTLESAKCIANDSLYTSELEPKDIETKTHGEWEPVGEKEYIEAKNAVIDFIRTFG